MYIFTYIINSVLMLLLYSFLSFLTSHEDLDLGPDKFHRPSFTYVNFSLTHYSVGFCSLLSSSCFVRNINGSLIKVSL